MRLIIAIVKGSDAPGLLDTLAERHIGATRLAATGGFMSEGRTTFLIGVEDDREDEAIDIIKKCCSNASRQRHSSGRPGSSAVHCNAGRIRGRWSHHFCHRCRQPHPALSMSSLVFAGFPGS